MNDPGGNDGIRCEDAAVLGRWDVVVCGGGPAGCAAAIAAARLGAKTLLIEKYGFLGGATVAQLVGVVLSTNGVDFQGVWHEWAARLLRYRAMAPLIRSPVPMYTGREWFRSSVAPEGVKRVWDDLLGEAGAEVLHLAHLCGARVDEGVVSGVIVHTRAGLGTIRAACVIDATGDAAVCHAAGVPWDRGVVGKPWPQQVSLVRRHGGVPAPGTQSGPAPGAGSTLAWLPEKLGRVDRLRVDPLDPFAVSAALQDARREIWERADALPGGQYLVESASELGVRTSRIVQGIARVTDDEAWEGRKAPDGIARSSWEFDVHPPDDERPLPERWFHSRSAANAAHAERIGAGDYFDIPYGCLVPFGVDGLLVAGRCVSAGYLAQGSLRIQQTCMATGQASGVAAALSLQQNKMPRKLDGRVVVAQLAKERDVEPAFLELRDLPVVWRED
ncbi:MAG: FAD-dependent oxidoreductase [Lentisphaerae bacterium]|nr:FAD-dependent oxidoreductase [Lentisphaerota bacterium]MBT4816631.1 FAD-dependent oxidoreductase [Lentisphaerota bacterium]MBT5606402.1 FAD-dependent oxidoreductase [Lentisphaerota bacterium]MBT7059746.1 FAD-dependent oxidoreductase [Lentisphaerota bacterium]MBT7847866.1 FAD-dependent oxidoreductase [Lentisphaerota bacterium]